MANKKKINHSFCNWFVLGDIGPTNGDELSLNLLKFVLLLYFFFLICFFGTSIIEEYSPAIFLYFTPKCNRSRHRSKQENLDHGEYRFHPIKFVNSVVPSSYETQKVCPRA